MKPMSDLTRYRLLYAVGMFFCLLPPLLAVLEYFPLWKKAGEGTLFSGGVVSLLSVGMMAAVVFPPTVRWLREKLIGTRPSAPLGFAAAAVIFRAVSDIVDAMAVIFTVAALGNFIGLFFFRMADRYEKKEE